MLVTDGDLKGQCGIVQFYPDGMLVLCFKRKTMQKLFISLALLLITCMTHAQSSQGLEEARKAILASNATFSDVANKGDGSIKDRYTVDACVLPPNGAPICGNENIATFFNGLPKVHSVFTIQHLYGDGSDFITEESHYELFDMNNQKLDDGKVIVIWKKTSEGWKMHRDMFSSNHSAKH
jgi:ketosteroid isomerase-like protein